MSVARRRAAPPPIRQQRRHSGSDGRVVVGSRRPALALAVHSHEVEAAVQLPFTPIEFFDVLSAYNSALWPGALALWFISVALVALAAGRPSPPARALSALLAVHWAWSALAYHAAYFTAVNPMAWLFAALFLIQAAAFLWYGVVHRRIQFSTGRSWRHIVGAMLIIYALVYPVINLALGSLSPRVPTFGVPCPTTLLTIGLLVPATMPSWRLAVIPIGWSIVGGSASFFFGVHADVMLPVAAVLWVTSLAMPTHALNQEASCSP